jgi:hypothetical protein
VRRALLLLLLAWTGAAQAHNRGVSYSEWTLAAGGASVQARVSELELTRLQLDPVRTPDYAQRAGETLSQNLRLWSRAGACVPGAVTVSASDDGWVTASWPLGCPSLQGLTIRSDLFLAVAPAHLHFARVARADGTVIERVLTYAEPALALDDPPPAAASFMHYVQLGVEHILSGWDHLSFILALILLAASVREVALVATGFTVAHSITLAVAVLGWAQVRAPAVEALIGFSIALVAAENLWLRAGRERWVPLAFAALLLVFALPGVANLPWLIPLGLAAFTLCYFALLRDAARPLRWRVAIAFLFGLVHGFGFAGVMTQMHLPAPRLAAGLLGFNTGVELGQLLVIAAVWPLLRLIDRLPAKRSHARDGVSAAICALGTFWFVTRAFG